MQKGGSQYGVPPPEMPPAASRPTTAGLQQPRDGPSPRLPVPQQQANFEEFAGNYTDDDPIGGADEADRGIGPAGNRWPRQETLALLKIRSDMDATFRDATLKGPLWEEVSRKMAEQGYSRSAKKCKEKFENVHKYYKRTKDSRAARPDGKSYRFFSQLEALHNASGVGAGTSAPSNTGAAANPATALPVTGPAIQQATPISSIPPVPAIDLTAAAGLSALGGVSFSSNSSASESETEDEDTEEGVGEHRKRKREDTGGGGSRKMMAFFEGLTKQVMERQEAMQQKFLETIEKREQDRMIREEAWRRQEMARLAQERDAMAQERAAAASRDATIISFLQKITGQNVPIQQPVAVPSTTPAVVVVSAEWTASANMQEQTNRDVQPAPQIQSQPSRQQLAPQSKTAPVEMTPVASQEQQQAQDPEAGAASGSMDLASSRWPKTEVHALIKIRAGMDARYQEAGPKGPLWEEISEAMRQIGYNRNAKRCKEKWENINKYFKKVKESKKKRPDDAKTCPYFHQLDALYRSKTVGSESSSGMRIHEDEPRAIVHPITMLAPPTNNGSPKGSAAQVLPGSNGGMTAASFVQETPPDLMKKPEDIMKELMDQHRETDMGYDYGSRMDDDMDDEDDDEDDDDADEDEQKMAYKIEFQRPSIASTTAASNSNGNKTAARGSAGPGSFLAMVHH